MLTQLQRRNYAVVVRRYIELVNLSTVIREGGGVTVRCGVCWDRALYEERPRKPPLLGWLSGDDKDGLYFSWQHVSSTRHRRAVGKAFDIDPPPEKARTRYRTLPELIEDGLQIKCRYGHEFRFTLDSLRRVLDATPDRKNILYLPAS